jgi:hypothetical protein
MRVSRLGRAAALLVAAFLLVGAGKRSLPLTLLEIMRASVAFLAGFSVHRGEQTARKAITHIQNS